MLTVMDFTAHTLILTLHLCRQSPSLPTSSSEHLEIAAESLEIAAEVLFFSSPSSAVLPVTSSAVSQLFSAGQKDVQVLTTSSDIEYVTLVP